MAADTTQWIGAQLADGRYTISALLGEGGMGLVFRAWDRNLNSDVVIKIPRMPTTAGQDFTRRFLREVHSLVKLAHPHIVRILDIGQYQAVPFAVMQYLPGGSLVDRFRPASGGPRAPLAPASLTPWLAEVASALDFIHSQHYVHRDVKPANILFDAHGNVYLGDFGVAKALATLMPDEQPLELTTGGMLVGTPGYLAPEMVLNRAYDGRADQYALAMVVYESLRGSHPFAGLSLSLVLVQQATKVLPELHREQAAIPEAVSAAIHKALAKDPAERYSTCTEFARAVLEAIRTSPPMPASHPGEQQPAGAEVLTALHAQPEVRPELTLTVTDQFCPTPPEGTQSQLLQAPGDEPPTRKRGRRMAGGLLAAIMIAALAGWLSWQRWSGDKLITRDDVITGSVIIDFKTRSDPANPEAMDTYQVDLGVCMEDDVMVNYSGTILRHSAGRPGQEGQGIGYRYQLNTTICQLGDLNTPLDDKQRPAGTISGVAFQNEQGVYQFDGVRWTPAVGPGEPFRGEVQGKKGKERVRGKRELLFKWEDDVASFVVEDSDPLVFHGLRIPGNPALGLQPATLRGELTFNYDTGSFLADDLVFEYEDGRADRVQGTIIWKKGPEYRSNGKSEYLFNLVFNGHDGAKPRLRAKLFSREAELLAVSRSVASLTGVVRYHDEGQRSEAGDGPAIRPDKSTISFHLHANRLTAQQIHTFVAMWLLMSGPINDE